MLGGGQTKKLKSLPPGVRVGNNAHAIQGGIRLWETTVSEAASPAPARPPASGGGKAAPTPA
jgi:polyphosphate glucokinase